jgi:hypothetical protein
MLEAAHSTRIFDDTVERRERRHDDVSQRIPLHVSCRCGSSYQRVVRNVLNELAVRTRIDSYRAERCEDQFKGNIRSVPADGIEVQRSRCGLRPTFTSLNDGLSWYRWGIGRKHTLLEREALASTPESDSISPRNSRLAEGSLKVKNFVELTDGIAVWNERTRNVGAPWFAISGLRMRVIFCSRRSRSRMRRRQSE